MQDFHHNRARALLQSAEELFTKQDVDAAVTAMADKLNARYNHPEAEAFPLVLGVMGGAVVFTGNLLPQLTFPLEFDYIHVSRYGDEDRGGEVVWKVVPRSNVAGRTVIVLDDILDEGETLAHVKQRLLDMGAAEVILAVFADKAIGKAKPVAADIVGLTIPNRFVVGFGMDAYGYWRNLPGLWAIRPEALHKD
ncbi:hypoxanthine phosphoribosyltransferase [Duganella sp. Leaf126]|uniref:hypoxanthine-guanine phosphoribosyltransferase n=1 Tax=Duganella sp. Leaf126 TaxID=1736266 RepID=UPI0006F530BB|nr:hypoxanthine-guanine phosphoribosyltransferase [Duganella sp. Leaf126]KQQ32823.1 hypoxanthine phosphoribosyltransferase [Duganella sp. Leaf126]